MKLLLAGRHAGSKGLLAPAEPPLVWLKAVRAWFQTAAASRIEGVRVDVESQQSPVLKLRLHPAAEEVSIVSADDAKVVVSAATASVGPGYHRWLCELLHAFGDAMHVSWAGPADGVGDPTGYFETGDARALEAQMLGWLSQAAARALELRRSGHEGAVALSLRFGHQFAHEAALLTPMGPRDEAWLLAVKDDPARGTDVFPWWEPGDTPRARLGRAETRLWTEMVWRPPLLDAERTAFKDIARLLESAWREDPTLPYPWREWRELLGYLGVGGTLAEEVSRRASLLGESPRIGYRRGAVDVALAGGWRLRIPGSLAEGPLPDGSWVARDHRRLIRLVPLERDIGPDDLPLGDEREQLHLSKRRVESRAAVRSDAEGGTLTAVCDAGRRRALVTIRFDDPDLREWAIETWRSIDFGANYAA